MYIHCVYGGGGEGGREREHTKQVHLDSTGPRRSCEIECVDDVDIRTGGISLRQQLRVKLSRNIEQNRRGKNDQVPISQLINRESHTFEPTVESAVFVIKCPQPI